MTSQNKNFVIRDGVKVCAKTSEGKLRFYDKDKKRSHCRGDNCVSVTPLELAVETAVRVENS